MSSAAPTRDAALDFTKGALVLLMVVYHGLNHFLGPQGEYYRYLRFITPSFIFITGYLAGTVYFAKCPTDWPVHTRLAQRGAKLLALFTLLNLAALAVFSRDLHDAEAEIGRFLENGFAIFVTGNRPPAQFWVLVPISYTLVVASVLPRPCQRFRFFLHGLCAALLAAVGATYLTGLPSGNLELFTVGVLGMLVGYAFPRQVQALANRVPFVAATYAGYLAAVAVLGATYPLQIAGVCANLMLLYLIGIRAGDSGALPRAVMLLGKYSLFGYIVHLAVVNVLGRVLLPILNPAFRLLAGVVLTAILTSLATLALDWSRRRSKSVDRIYRVAFA